jgi:hypothetical protein
VRVPGDEGACLSQVETVQRLLERNPAALRIDLDRMQFDAGREFAPGRHGPLQFAAAADDKFIRQISPPSG